MSRHAQSAWSFAKTVLSVGPVVVAINDLLPTLNPQGSFANDRVVEDKLSPLLGRFQRGDVVVLLSPEDPHSRIVKRVIALEGDWVSHTPRDDVTRVPRGHCWVEGDNPGMSMDSASLYGPVPLALIEGVVRHVVWPISRIGKVESKQARGRVVLRRGAVDNI
mmetsp:Transcript_11130/g.35323  ORF Transcript_11130/g.35323 Transcript_11130/m.35323 type:complete len:163 (+) Transcript_11130:34-522(+)